MAECPRLRSHPSSRVLPHATVLQEGATLLVAETCYDHALAGIKITSRFSRCANVGFRLVQGEQGRAWPPFSQLLAALAEPTIKLLPNSDVFKRMLKRCAN